MRGQADPKLDREGPQSFSSIEPEE